MLRQFKMAVEAALADNQETRTMVRARYLLQKISGSTVDGGSRDMAIYLSQVTRPD